MNRPPSIGSLSPASSLSQFITGLLPSRHPNDSYNTALNPAISISYDANPGPSPRLLHTVGAPLSTPSSSPHSVRGHHRIISINTSCSIISHNIGIISPILPPGNGPIGHILNRGQTPSRGMTVTIPISNPIASTGDHVAASSRPSHVLGTSRSLTIHRKPALIY